MIRKINVDENGIITSVHTINADVDLDTESTGIEIDEKYADVHEWILQNNYEASHTYKFDMTSKKGFKKRSKETLRRINKTLTDEGYNKIKEFPDDFCKCIPEKLVKSQEEIQMKKTKDKKPRWWLGEE